jgi:5'-3' exonuclease
MGVNNFFKIRAADKTIEDNGVLTPLNSLANQKVCIDASFMIYNSILAMKFVNILTDSAGKSTGHINTIFNKIIQMYQSGIEQVWIFDSPTANPLKILTLEKRNEKRTNATDVKQAFKMTSEHVGDIQQLLRLMGIMYIVSPPGVEAEQYGAYLTRGSMSERFCKYMISGDSDVLCFRGNLLRVSTERSTSGKTKKTVYYAYELDDLLNELELTYDEFLKVCVSMGTDFNNKTDGVGPAKIVDQVKKDALYYSPRQIEVMEYYKSDITNLIGQSTIIQDPYQSDALINWLRARAFSEKTIHSRLTKYKPTAAAPESSTAQESSIAAVDELDL